MKYLIVIISFLLLPIIISASDKPYLTSLEITNGVNTISFDSKNDLYTINVYEDINSLDINYKVDKEDTIVEIIGNDLVNDVNDVYLNLDYLGNTNSYHLIVNKINNDLPAFNAITSDDIKKDNYLMQGVVIVSVILINLICIKKLLFN